MTVAEDSDGQKAVLDAADADFPQERVMNKEDVKLLVRPLYDAQKLRIQSHLVETIRGYNEHVLRGSSHR